MDPTSSSPSAAFLARTLAAQGIGPSADPGGTVDLESSRPALVRRAVHERWPDLAVTLAADGPAWLDVGAGDREILAAPDAVPARRLADAVRGARPVHGARADLLLRFDDALSAAERRGIARLVSEHMRALPPRPQRSLPEVPGLTAEERARWAREAEGWAAQLSRRFEEGGREAFDLGPLPPRPPRMDHTEYHALVGTLQRWALYRIDPRAAVAAWKAVALPAISTVALLQADLDGTVTRVTHPSLEEAVALAVAQGIHPDTRAAARELGVQEGLEAYAGWAAIGGWVRVKPGNALAWDVLHAPPLDLPFATAVRLRQIEAETWPVRLPPDLALARPGLLHPQGILLERIAGQLGEARFHAALAGAPEARRAFEACARDTLARFDAEPERFFDGHCCVRTVTTRRPSP